MDFEILERRPPKASDTCRQRPALPMTVRLFRAGEDISEGKVKDMVAMAMRYTRTNTVRRGVEDEFALSKLLHATAY